MCEEVQPSQYLCRNKLEVSRHRTVPRDAAGSGSNLQEAATSSHCDVQPASKFAACRAAAAAVGGLKYKAHQTYAISQ